MYDECDRQIMPSQDDAHPHASFKPAMHVQGYQASCRTCIFFISFFLFIQRRICIVLIRMTATDQSLKTNYDKVSSLLHVHSVLGFIISMAHKEQGNRLPRRAVHCCLLPRWTRGRGRRWSGRRRSWWCGAPGRRSA
jgi:hypothetical protein